MKGEVPLSDAFEVSQVGLVDQTLLHEAVGDLLELDAAYAHALGAPLQLVPWSPFSIDVQLFEEL